MSRQNLLNLSLLLFIGLLVLLVIYEPGIESPAENPPLLDINRATITQIRIERQGQETVTLERNENDKWQLTAPLAIAASDFRIDSILRISEQKSLGHYPADSERLAHFGLDTPRVTLTLGDKVKIAFGDSTPLDQRRYVQIDDKVHLINDTLYYHLIGSYTTFIRQQLLPEGSNINAITLPDLTIRWQDDRWQVEPKPEMFSTDQVTHLIDAWKLASAVQVKPYDGMDGKTITIKPRGESAIITFLLTAHSPDLVLARPELGIQYHLPESSEEELLKLQPLEEAAE